MAVEDEDLVLARQVLASKSPPAIEQLISRYHPRLVSQAKAAVRRLSGLPNLYEADALVNDFLAEKFLPPHKLAGMLGRVVDDNRPLWPLLSRSFENYLIDLARQESRLRISRGTVLGTGEDELNPVDRLLDHSATIMERVAEQIATIRQHLPPDDGPPFGAVLLLTERISLAASLVTCYEPHEERMIWNQSVRELVECTAAWEKEDSARRLLPTSVTVGELWESICVSTEGRPHLARPALIAEVLGIRKACWNQWVSRGRRELLEQLGRHRIERLFPRWFRQPSAASARGAEARS